jgi:hypothetical protein
VTYNVSGADYQNSAHDYIIDADLVGYQNTETTFSAFQPNCTKCHTDPVGLDGRQDGTYKVAPHFSDDESRLAKALGAALAGTSTTEENLCFVCHDSASAGNDGYGVQAMGSAARNVEYYFTTTDAGYATYRHNVVGYSDIHVTDEDQADINANGEHIECEDCHNPHTLGDNTLNSTNHSTGTNGIGSTSPIAGVTGIEATFGGEWASPSAYSEVTADKEHEICFKCHSGANTNLTTWNAAWTNVALEFNPANDSFHPVVAALNSAGSGSAVLDDARVGDGGTPENFEPGATMYCSDCHMDNAVTPRAMGPHGSAQAHILRGTWSTTSSLSSATSYTLCSECHTVAGTNVAHQQNRHQDAGIYCIHCHVAIPHGSKVSRLLVTTNAPPPYDAGARLVAVKFPVSKFNCQALTGAPCGNNHNSAPTAPYETW